MTENDEQEHKHVEDDCKRADIKTLHVLTSNRMNFVKTICKVLQVFWKGNNMEIYCKMLQCLIDANTAVPMIDIANDLYLDKQDATSRFEYMSSQGWILPSRNDAGKIRITTAGRQQFRLMTEQLRATAQARKDARIAKYISFASLVVSIASVLVSAFT